MMQEPKQYYAYWQRTSIARNMADALTYLIGIASSAQFEKVAETLKTARNEVSKEVPPCAVSQDQKKKKK